VWNAVYPLTPALSSRVEDMSYSKDHFPGGRGLGRGGIYSPLPRLPLRKPVRVSVIEDLLLRHNHNVTPTAIIANPSKGGDAMPSGLKDLPPKVARLPKVE